MAVQSIPAGYHTVTPYLVVDGVEKLIDFLKRAFDAGEHERMTAPDGTIPHAEVQIGDSKVMMGQTRAGHPTTRATLYVYVPDVDSTYQQAIKAGGISIQAPVDQFYGDRSGGVTDPCGNQWWIATHKEDVPPDELMRRARAAGKA